MDGDEEVGEEGWGHVGHRTWGQEGRADSVGLQVQLEVCEAPRGFPQQ